MSAICVIPARGGSRRIPRKNVRLFHGKPIIAYSIEAAFVSQLFGQHVYVSTDGDEIADVAQQYGAGILARSPGLSADEVGTQEVMANALKSVRGRGDPEWGADDYACCLYPCSPLLKVYDLMSAMEYIVAGQCMTYIYSVGPDRVDCGNFYIGPARAFIDGAPLEGNSTTFQLEPERVCDINTPADWSRAETMYARLHGIDMTRRPSPEVNLAEGSR